HAGVTIKLHGGGFVAAARGHIEPDAESAGGPDIAIAIAEDLVGEIELDAVKPAVFLDMRLIAVSCDRDLLQRHRHLRCGDVAQLVKGAETSCRRPRNRRACPASSNASTAIGTQRHW